MRPSWADTSPVTSTLGHAAISPSQSDDSVFAHRHGRRSPRSIVTGNAGSHRLRVEIHTVDAKGVNSDGVCVECGQGIAAWTRISQPTDQKVYY